MNTCIVHALCQCATWLVPDIEVMKSVMNTRPAIMIRFSERVDHITLNPNLQYYGVSPRIAKSLGRIHSVVIIDQKEAVC